LGKALYTVIFSTMSINIRTNYHDHNALYSVALMDSAFADTQTNRYPFTVPTNVTWAGKSDTYMTW